LIVKRYQIDPLHGTVPFDAVTVNRFDHDSLAARLAEHFGNAVAVSHECSAGWSTANTGSGAFLRHREKDFWNTYDYANSAHAMRLLAIVSVVYSKSYVFVMRRIVVRRSPVHGRGVFALTTIPFGE
jgi:hypothetical protein